MSLPKKDAHVYFDHDWHEAIASIAESQGMSVTAWVEQAAKEKADLEIRKASLVMSRLEQSGALRIIKDRGEK